MQATRPWVIRALIPGLYSTRWRDHPDYGHGSADQPARLPPSLMSGVRPVSRGDSGLPELAPALAPASGLSPWSKT
jgi:hypothetical protein